MSIECTTTESHLGSEKTSWGKASVQQKEDYKVKLDQLLNNISVPESIQNCRDVHCNDPTHCDASDELTSNILSAVQIAANESLPIVKPSARKKSFPKPGWSSEVKPYQDTAYFWSQVWKSAGCPLNTELHKIMKRTRNVFHYQVKKCKKFEDLVRRNKLLDACLNGNGDIFEEIKKIRQSKPVIATSMDGEKEDIPEHFRKIYSELYNSVNDKEELLNLKDEVEGRINSSHLQDVDLVTADIVREASNNLKDNKTDPVCSFSSDCLKAGSDKLFSLLSLSIKSYLIHGHVTLFLLLATLIPIVKDKLGSINSSKNYRSIAISSLILKLIDWVILLLFGESLGLDELQFAYQPGCSTYMCTWAVLETIGYFMRNGSDVFVCTMTNDQGLRPCEA